MDSETLINENSEESEENVNETKNQGYVTVEPVLGAVFLAQVLSDSVLTELFLKQTCKVELSLNASFCASLGTNTTQGHMAESIVQPHVANYLMWKTILQCIIPAILSVFLGPWSDQFGRKPIIVFSLAGCGLSYAIYAILAYIPDLQPSVLLIGILPFSLMGGYVNMIAACVCFLSDISSVEKRSLRLAALEGVIMAGSLIGLPLAGKLFNSAEKTYKLGYLTSFGVSAALCWIGLVYMVFCVKESVDVKTNSSGLRKLVDLSYPKDMWRTCFKPRSGYQRSIILMCGFILGSIILILEGEAQIGFLFSRLRFGWDLSTYTTVSALLLAIYAIGMIFGCWILPKCIQISDVYLCIYAFSTDIAQNMLKAAAGPGQAYFLFIGASISAMKAVIGPCIRAILSRVVPPEDLGKVFAFTFSMESILPIASGPLYVLVYNETLNFLPGAAYLLSASFYAIDLIFLLVVARLLKSHVTP